MNNWVFYVLILNCFLSAFSQVLLKKASLKNYSVSFKEYFNFYVISGYGLFFIVLCVNILLLKRLPLTIVNPIGETIPILLSFVSGHFIFNEKITRRKTIGIVFILMGVLLILL